MGLSRAERGITEELVLLWTVTELCNSVLQEFHLNLFQWVRCTLQYRNNTKLHIWEHNSAGSRSFFVYFFFLFTLLTPRLKNRCRGIYKPLCQTKWVRTLKPCLWKQLVTVKYFSFLQHVNKRPVQNSNKSPVGPSWWSKATVKALILIHTDELW